MQEKSYKNSKTSLLGHIKSNLVSFRPVLRNGWIIKFSIYDNKNILLMIVSKYTAETMIKYFTEEKEAVDYINFIVSREPKEYINK
jgi:hypothetical protein